MTKRRKWTYGVGAGVVVLIVGWSVLNPETVTVEAEQVRRDSLSVTVSEEGRTRARERYTVSAPITGRVLRVEVEEGDAVARGDLLALVAPPPEDPRILTAARAEVDVAEARLSAARSDLIAAQAAQAQAQREVERRRPLLDLGAISREALERFEHAARTAASALAASEAAVRGAEAGVAQANSRLLGATSEMNAEVVQLPAPVSGRVLRVREKSERVVPAGTPLFDIADVGGLEVVVDLLTEEAVLVQPGALLRVSGWGGTEVLTGTVRYVEPAAFTKVSALGVEEQRVDVVGDLDASPPGLGDGFRLDVAIVVWQGADVLTVPSSALFQRAGGWQVFVIEEGRARMRPVDVGHRGVARSEVLDGLDAGDQVISYPSDLVGEGVRVSPASGAAGSR